MGHVCAQQEGRQVLLLELLAADLLDIWRLAVIACRVLASCCIRSCVFPREDARDGLPRRYRRGRWPLGARFSSGVMVLRLRLRVEHHRGKGRCLIGRWLFVGPCLGGQEPRRPPRREPVALEAAALPGSLQYEREEAFLIPFVVQAEALSGHGSVCAIRAS